MLGESPSFTNEQERQRLETALRESEILRELAELLASSLDLKRVLQVLTKRTSEVCKVERCSVWLVDEAHEVFRPAAYYISPSARHMNRKSMKAANEVWHSNAMFFDDPEMYQRLKEKGMLVLDDFHNQPRVSKIAETFLVRSILLVALKREGRIVGMLSLDDPGQECTFSPEQQQLVRAIGQQAALAIDNARLYQEAQTERKRAERLIERAQAIYQVALTVNSGEDLKVVLEIATHHLIHALDADDGAIVLLDEGTLHVVSHTSKAQDTFRSEAVVELAHLPSCHQAAITGKPLFIHASEAGTTEAYWYHQLELDNVLIVPLIVRSSQTIGFAFVSYQNAHEPPGKGQYAFAQDIAAQCALAIEKAHLLADLHHAAELATEQANTLNTVFQAMTEGITVLNQDGQLLARNKAASQFLGNPLNFISELGTFLQRYPAYTLHGQPLTAEDFPLMRAFKGEHIRGERFIITRSDGVERVVEMNVTHMLDNAKQRIGLVSAFRDITEQTLVERRIRQALETMLHVAEAVSGITDINDILYSVLERTLSTLNCQRGLVQLFDEKRKIFMPLLSIGFSEKAKAEWIEEQSFWLAPGIDHVYRTQLLAGHATVINGREYPFEPNPLAPFLILAAPITHHDHLLGLIMLDRATASKSGTLREREYNEFNIWDLAIIEGVAQLAGLAIEQARWQELATNARTSEAAMREANTLKDEFLAITAHEFRTPLTVILAHCQVALRMLRKMSDPGPLQRLNDGLSIIEDQTHQLTNIVNTFLEVTQINRGQLTIKSEPVDIAETAKHVVTNHSHTSALHSISYSITPCEQPYLVLGDSFRLAQILANLIQNAIKYSPLGGPITVSLCQHSADGGEKASRTIEVCVSDTGIGIPKDAQSRLFERFYRAPNIQDSKTKGIGLGLYIVAELLHMHGGTIYAESSGVLGEGSRFIFTLPALEEGHPQSDISS